MNYAQKRAEILAQIEAYGRAVTRDVACSGVDALEVRDDRLRAFRDIEQTINDLLAVPGADRIRARLQTAIDKAAQEAATHLYRQSAMYCDGQAAGLRAALRMLDEEAGR